MNSEFSRYAPGVDPVVELLIQAPEGASELQVMDVQPNGESTDNFLTNRRQNPSAAATLSLLAQVHYAGKPLSSGEIIAERHGGIYPTRTREELKMLVEAGLITETTNPEGAVIYTTTNFGSAELAVNEIQPPQYVKAQIAKALRSIEKNPPRLPFEKYGNEEFRFTWQSVAELMEKMFEANANARMSLSAIGSPLIGLFATRCPELFNSVTIFDINNEIIEIINNESRNQPHIIGAHYDATMPFPPTLSGRFDAMVFDPPWHNEHYCLFADRAWQALRPLGRAYISTFAPATRPEANRELAELYRRFMAGGFNIAEIVPQFFGYTIPEFERRVFESQGIFVTSRGNYGQLLVLEKERTRTETCLTPELAEKIVGEIKIDLRGMDTAAGTSSLWIGRDKLTQMKGIPLQIEPVNNGGVYNNTSRSQRRREGVNILTKDQIGYKCSNPGKMYFIYLLWQNKMPMVDVVVRMMEAGIVEDNEEGLRDAALAFQFFEQYA